MRVRNLLEKQLHGVINDLHSAKNISHLTFLKMHFTKRGETFFGECINKYFSIKELFLRIIFKNYF